MKKILFTVVLFASTTIIFGQHYFNKNLGNLKINENASYTRGDALDVNADFEIWSSQYAGMFGEFPQGWFMLTGNQDANKSEDAYEGSYAMHVESNVTSYAMMGWVDTLVGGRASIGKIQGMGVAYGEVYTKRPVSISFYLKGEMAGDNDTALIAVQLEKNGQIVGEAFEMYGKEDLSSSWEQKTINFEYFNEDTPSSVLMFVTSSGVGVLQNDTIGTLTAGSYVDIDKLSLKLATGVEDDFMPEAAIYPNPAQDYTIIENQKNAEFSINNIMGQTLMSRKIRSNYEKIELSNIPAGTYIINLKKNNKVISKKISITR